MATTPAAPLRCDALDPLQLMPAAPTRADLDAMAARIMAAEQAGHGIEILTWHHHADGMVSRTILVDAGTWLEGAEHIGEHLCVCAGDITVFTEGGHTRFRGYHVVTSLAGAKRIGFAHADTWWTTFHLNPDNCRDVGELERRFVRNPEQLQANRHALAAPPAMEMIQ
jgi:hypothetical protein